MHMNRFILKRVRQGKPLNKPRLSIFCSHKHIYAQIIDDVVGMTLVSASTYQYKQGWKSTIKYAQEVGQLLAKKALQKGIKQVVLDRGKYRYHGKIRALTEAARNEGLRI
nr:ribosomal protein L18 [Cyanidioschyzonaceae sp. 2]UNJ16010.1 ribosomal protein L18 [Cyanidioschyzonaceae sp. 3]